MANHPLSLELALETVRAVERHGGLSQAAKALRIPRNTLRCRYQAAERMGLLDGSHETGFVVHQPPSADIPIEELVEHRKKQFQQKARHEQARKLIDVSVRLNGPIGILHFGDPHVDDDGTDIALLQSHAELVRKTEGLFAANVGDTTNNWVGRLARLYSEQSTTASDAWRLAEWFIGLCDWLYIIGGNHDGWSGAGDPLRWITQQQGAFYQPSEARLALRFPCGAEVRVNARHDFAGSSQWNPAHGSAKAFQMGMRDHININGHKHVSGYAPLKDPATGLIGHCIQVASYKTFDRYARERGFRDQSFGPCVLTTINPALPQNHPDAIKAWWDPFEGADYLAHLRRRVAHG